MDTPVEVLKQQMDVNYFSAAYTAHAAVRAWLDHSSSSEQDKGKATATSSSRPLPKQLVLTSSIVTLVPIAGYAQYAPAKIAVRTLAESLSQELLLYEHHTPIRCHTVLPGTIFTEGLDRENQTKAGITKKIEETDGGQTAEEVARATLAALDRGDELITTNGLLGLAMKATMLSSAKRAGWGIVDTVMAWIVTVVIVFVRRDFDNTVRKWGAAGKP